MMERLWLWITREDGTVEQHIGPFEYWLKLQDPDKKPGIVKAVVDQEKLGEAHGLLKKYAGAKVYDVMADLDPKVVAGDKTGALQVLATSLAEVAARVLERQNRERRGTLRAGWMADIDLAALTVNFRAE